MCSKGNNNTNKGIIISCIISLISGILTIVFRINTKLISIIVTSEKMIVSISTIVIIFYQNKKKTLNKNLSEFDEVNNIIGSFSERIKTIEKLCKKAVNIYTILCKKEGEDMSNAEKGEIKKEASECKIDAKNDSVSQLKKDIIKEDNSQGKIIVEKTDESQGKIIGKNYQVNTIPKSEGLFNSEIKDKVLTYENDIKNEFKILCNTLSIIYNSENKICVMIKNLNISKIIELIS